MEGKKSSSKEQRDHTISESKGANLEPEQAESDSDSTGSGGSSSSSQTRLKQFFFACDTDGDGFIDGRDILLVCQELNMTEPLHEIMDQLDADEHGRISLEDFLRTQRKLKTENQSLIKGNEKNASLADLSDEKLRFQSSGSNTLESSTSSIPPSGLLGSLPASSENSLGASSTAKDSWDRDSGARDLSPEPARFLQKLMDSVGPASGAVSNLENANMLHLAALASLKGEIIELTNRLQKVSSDRDAYEKKLAKLHVERARLMRDNEEKLDQQAMRYEERITELHSVIAELNKKIGRSHGDAIREEDELSHSSPRSNMSNSGGSGGSGSFFHGSESVQVDTSNPDISEELSRVVGDLECVMEGRRGESGLRNEVLSAQQEVEKIASATQQTEKQALQAVKDVVSLTGDRSPSETHGSSSHNSMISDHRRRSSLEQEVCMLREENETLNNTLSMKEEEMQKLKANLMAIRDEKEKLRRKVKELQARIQNGQSSSVPKDRMGYTSSSSTEQLSSPNHRSFSMDPSHLAPGAHRVNPSTGEPSYSGSERKGPVAKMAERVRLRPSKSDTASGLSGSRPVLGAEISHGRMTNPKVAEHLAQSLQECSNVQEIFQTLSSHGLSVPESKIFEIEVEMERLNSKIDHLRSQNDLLQLSLEESKSNANRMTMMLGKYESNNTALQLAVNYSDQTIEAYEALLSLSRSEQQLFLANCKAAGAGIGMSESSEGSGEDAEDTTMRLKRVHEDRKTTENTAKALLQRLDRSCGTMVCHMTGSSLQPWEDVSSHTSHTSTTSSTASSCDTEFSKDDEQRLRDYAQQLKNDRAAVRLTVMEMESIYIDPVDSNTTTPSSEGHKLDLENAVLMQELTALKEEKSELKAQYYLLEKEKKAVELKLNSREAQEQAYLVQISHLKSEVRDRQDGRIMCSASSRARKEPFRYKDGSISDSGTQAISLAEVGSLDDTNIPTDMAEVIRREKKLKARIHELVSTLEKLQRSSELRHQQSAEFVADLKRANSALVTAYEKAKKKHQSRLKKVEAQMMAMVERHDTQVRMLKQRIALLEENQIRPVHNETSL